MAGGITPKRQPVDVYVGKVFKGLFRKRYDNYMLHAPEDEKGHPRPPSGQQVATWVVEAWEEIPEELLQKAWVTAGYKTMEEVKNGNPDLHQLTPYERDDIVRILDPIDGGKSTFHYLNVENEYGDDGEEDENAGWEIQPKNK
ncbi:hypothetical protein CTEN210_07210 [Chaetoceros tenuissimus]|uniref:DDE-1 domain-containing protein n=1 Tax=Chaetoceros tenuissimus TaxID=426638 RepID=A0AAD3H5J8_9STRA|nr:hypothetical protein CTEN210_07210 [Chaetoceros tenuissimus]